MITILTDMPDWNRPLEEVLLGRHVDLEVITDPQGTIAGEILLNRVSAAAVIRDPVYAKSVVSFLHDQESGNLRTVNGASTFRIGSNKWAQNDVFKKCGVHFPATKPVESTRRHFPDRPVIIKASGGGYGAGIYRLADWLISLMEK